MVCTRAAIRYFASLDLQKRVNILGISFQIFLQSCATKGQTTVVDATREKLTSNHSRLPFVDALFQAVVKLRPEMSQLVYQLRTGPTVHSLQRINAPLLKPKRWVLLVLLQCVRVLKSSRDWSLILENDVPISFWIWCEYGPKYITLENEFLLSKHK